jgi:hypothetical protein
MHLPYATCSNRNWIEIGRNELVSKSEDLSPNRSTPAFHQHYIAPAAIHLAQPLSHADDAKSRAFMQRDARDVLGKDGGLQRPDAFGFRFGDQARQQLPPTPRPRADSAT